MDCKKRCARTNEKWDILEKNLIKDKIRFSKIPIDEARDLTPDFVQLNEDEVFYYEPDALQYDPADVRRALYEGVRRSNITLMEKTEVIGFRKNTNGLISNVITNKEVLSCDHVINAAVHGPHLYLPNSAFPFLLALNPFML